jgi:RHS repeat-associated protein
MLARSLNSVSAMRDSVKIFGAILANFGIFSNAVLANLPQITFEAPVYTTVNPIDYMTPPGDWSSYNGMADISPTGTGYAGGQALRLKQGLNDEAWLNKRVNWTPADGQVAFIDFQIKPGSSAIGSLADFLSNGTQLAFQIPENTTTGQIWVLNGNDDRTGAEQWMMTNSSFTVASGDVAAQNWMRVTIRQDYDHKIWDLFVNGQLVAVNLGFEEREGLINSLNFYGSKVGDTLVDNLQVLPTNMLYTDTDKDGIPNAWETANGTNPNVYDRDTIVNGKSNLDRYLDSLNSTRVNGQASQALPIGSIPPLDILGSHQSVGALKGSMNVGADGAATYSIPLDLPKGTAGMEPKLSLDYSSSNTTDGILGLGWSIGGLQQITRGPTSFKKDGYVNGVNFNDDDRFFLDGQRLVCISGTYGQAGSEYRTEIDAYARIRFDGSIWKVQTKAGLTMFFGSSESSRLTAPAGKTIDGKYAYPGLATPQASPGGAIAWSLDRVEDTYGNYYQVNYTKDSSAVFAESTYGAPYNYRISSIDYTGNAIAANQIVPYAHIVFNYEDRSDQRLFYTTGLRQLFRKRLASIMVLTGGQVNHTYNIAYDYSEQTGRSLLKSISKSAKGVTLPATTFKWQTTKTSDVHWVEGGTVNIKEYGSGLDSVYSTPGYVYMNSAYPVGDGSQYSSSDSTCLHLSGNVSRAIPFSYHFTKNTKVQFEFYCKDYTNYASSFPYHVEFGLDENLSTSTQKRMFSIVSVTPPPLSAPNPPPISSYSTEGYTQNDSGNWKTIRIALGSAYNTSGDINYLTVLNRGKNLAGYITECWIKNIKVYEDPSDPTDVSSLTFGNNFAVPKMKDSSNDLGVKILDFSGDGVSDIHYDILSYAEDPTYDILRPSRTIIENIAMRSYGDTLLGTSEGFISADHAKDDFTVLTGGTISSSLAGYAARLAMPANFFDIDGDGICEAISVRNLTKILQPNNFKFQLKAATWKNDRWTDSPLLNLPFYCLVGSGSTAFSYYRFEDIDGDGDKDLVLRTRSGSLYDITSGTKIVPTNTDMVWINQVSDGLSPAWRMAPEWALPVQLTTDGGDEWGRRLQDCNADGLPDLVMAGSTSPRSSWLNWGRIVPGSSPQTCWVKQTDPTYQDSKKKDDGTGSPINLPVILTNGDNEDRGARIIDLNGDGVSDVIKDYHLQGYTDKPTQVFLGTGAGWDRITDDTPPASDTDTSAWYLKDDLVSINKYGVGNPNPGEFVDINADGLVDFVVAKYGTGKNYVHINTGTGWADVNSAFSTAFRVPALIYKTTTAFNSGNATGTFADVNGDGIIDFISDMDTPTPKVWINQCKTEVITAATDGFGRELNIEYTRLNDSSPLSHTNQTVYTPNPNSVPDGQVKILGNTSLVVSRVYEPDGMGGFRAQRRHYGDMRIDRPNEVSLGFGWIEIHQEHFRADGSYQEIGYNRTETKQEYPYNGSPVYSQNFINVTSPIPGEVAGLPEGNISLGMHLVSEEISRYDQLLSTSGVGGTVVRPVQVYSQSIKYSLDGVRTSEVTMEQPIANYNSDGFVEYSISTALDGTKTKTTSTYDRNVEGDSWQLGRLRSTSVIKDGGYTGTSVNKKSTFNYNTKGLLCEEVVEPDNQILTTKTSYLYDPYGNIRQKSVEGCVGESPGSKQTRTTSTVYDTNGRFPVEITSPLGTVVNTYDSGLGVLTSTTDIDGLKTTYQYDTFNTLVCKNLPDGTRSAEITRFVTNAFLPPNVQALLAAHGESLVWSKAAQSSGTPWAVVYYDTLGREVIKQTTVITNYDGAAATYKDQFTATFYDQKGRKLESYLPFFADETPTYFSRPVYDCMDRAIRTIKADGTMDVIESIETVQNNRPNDPLVHTVIKNARNSRIHRWENQHGLLVRSSDESNQITNFRHDIEARVCQVDIDGVLQLENGYDSLGKKISVSDLSGGTSSAKFNAFGEQIYSINARGQRTDNEYDALGRLVKVTKPGAEGVFQYIYRNNQGFTTSRDKLDRVIGPDGYSEIMDYDAFGRVTAVTKTQFGQTSTTSTQYSPLGLPIVETDAGGVSVTHQYDNRYQSIKIRTFLAGSSAAKLWEFNYVSKEGSLLKTSESLAHGVVRTVTTDVRNGRIKKILAVAGDKTLQNLDYTWDEVGNVASRIDNIVNKTESFQYDALDRLVQAQVTGQSAIPYQYDGLSSGSIPAGFHSKGNLTTKGGSSIGYYSDSYRAKDATIKGKARTYSYDASGNVLSDGLRTFVWSSNDQVQYISQESAPGLKTLAETNTYASPVVGIAQNQLYTPSLAEATFEFDAAGNRVRQTVLRTFSDTSQAMNVKEYLGSYERETESSKSAGGSGFVATRTLERHTLGASLYTVETNRSGSQITGTNVRLAVILTDHIGSTDVIYQGKQATSAVGSQLATWDNFKAERQSFDSWGERRHGDTWGELRSSFDAPQYTSGADTDKGYTGHEMLDDFGLIHMNGRIYDAELGRFLGADPYVQVPEFSQNFNRYSYVLNNPLTMTDPSGHSWIGDNWIMIVAIVVVAIVTWGLSTAITSGYLFTSAGFAAGGALTPLGMAVVGAISGAIGGAIGPALAGAPASEIFKGAAIGAVQGAIAGGVLHGMGQSAKAAIAAGTSTATELSIEYMAGHALLGGVCNEAMGGKFQDGALSGAATAGFSLSGMTEKMGMGDEGDWSHLDQVAERTAMAGVLGGTATAIGGGKFGNGFYTAAFQHLLNAEGGIGNFAKGSVNAINKTLDVISRSPFGYIWNLPNTAVGVALGGLGLMAEAVMYPITLKWDFKITIESNAISFDGVNFMMGGITFGNAINIGYGPWNKYDLDRNTLIANGTRMIDHEEQHTYQGQLLGPLYIPNAGLSLAAGLIFDQDSHGPSSWNEVGPSSFPPRPWRSVK